MQVQQSVMESRRRKRSKNYIGFRMFLNGIEPDKEIKEIYNMIDHEMINGLMLSDACTDYDKKQQSNSRFILVQSIKNQDLCYDLKEHFDAIGLKSKLKELLSTTYSSKQVRLVSQRHPFFSFLRETWYPNGNKIVPKNISITAKTLAYWFMGDGSSTWRKKGYDFNGLCNVNLATESFSEDDNSFLISELKKLGIKGIKYSGNMKYDNLHLNTTLDVIKFMEMIKPFILPCFDYKIKIPRMTSHEIVNCKRNRDPMGRYL